MKETKLNLGCGKDVRTGWINVDKALLPGIDVVHDLNKFPYPFNDNSADYILMKHTLEHLDDVISVMNECHRILKPYGKLEIIVPYYKYKTAFSDPTHKHFFTERSMNFFIKQGISISWYTDKKYRLVKFDKIRGAFPAYHIKKYFGINLNIGFRVNELRWILEAIK